MNWNEHTEEQKLFRAYRCSSHQILIPVIPLNSGTQDSFLLPQYNFSKHKTFLQKEGEKNKISKMTKHDRKVQKRK